MISLRMNEKESKAETVEAKENEGPVYPWGMCLNPDSETMEKLGIKASKYEVGDEIEIKCVCRVKNIGSYEYMSDGKPVTKSNMSLQVVAAEIEEMGEGQKTAKKIYK